MVYFRASVKFNARTYNNNISGARQANCLFLLLKRSVDFSRQPRIQTRRAFLDFSIRTNASHAARKRKFVR